MARRTVKVSDIDGSEPADYTVLVRQHPSISAAKLLDVTQAQVNDLNNRGVKGVLTIDVKDASGNKTEVFISQQEFDKWLGKNPQEVLNNASFAQGRPKGYSPNGG